jgi:hypothetical protein
VSRRLEAVPDRWITVQSQTVLEWQAGARAGSALQVLEARFGPVPADLEAAIRPTLDTAKLQLWIRLVATVGSMDDFRQSTGI